MNLQKLLAENMLRFGSKNLDTKAKQKLKRLAEQTAVLNTWINWPQLLGKTPISGPAKMYSLASPKDEAIIFITQNWMPPSAGTGNQTLNQSEIKIDNRTLYGLIGSKWLYPKTPDMAMGGNLIIGNAVTPGTSPSTATDSGVLYALVASAKPNNQPFDNFLLNQDLSTLKSTVYNFVALKTTSYVESVQQIYSIFMNGAAVKQGNVVDLTIDCVNQLVAAGKVPAKPATLTGNGYSILTMKI